MNDLDIIDEHMLIRDTVGYDVIATIEPWDLPQVLQFLEICQNYIKMEKILKEN